jgi:hypothetical protein
LFCDWFNLQLDQKIYLPTIFSFIFWNDPAVCLQIKFILAQATVHAPQAVAGSTAVDFTRKL